MGFPVARRFWLAASCVVVALLVAAQGSAARSGETGGLLLDHSRGLKTVSCNGFEIFEGLNFDGGDIGPVSAASAAECCEKCRTYTAPAGSTVKCTAWTYGQGWKPEPCWLKSAGYKDPPINKNDGAISGKRLSLIVPEVIPDGLVGRTLHVENVSPLLDACSGYTTATVTFNSDGTAELEGYIAAANLGRAPACGYYGVPVGTTINYEMWKDWVVFRVEGRASVAMKMLKNYDIIWGIHVGQDFWVSKFTLQW